MFGLMFRFGRKHKQTRPSLLGSTIKSMVTRDMEKFNEEEITIPKNPITWWNLTHEQRMRIPYLKRCVYWRLTEEELRYYFGEETKEEIQKELPALPKPHKDPKKDLISNELVKNNPPRTTNSIIVSIKPVRIISYNSKV